MCGARPSEVAEVAGVGVFWELLRRSIQGSAALWTEARDLGSYPGSVLTLLCDLK